MVHHISGMDDEERSASTSPDCCLPTRVRKCSLRHRDPPRPASGSSGWTRSLAVRRNSAGHRPQQNNSIGRAPCRARGEAASERGRKLVYRLSARDVVVRSGQRSVAHAFPGRGGNRRSRARHRDPVVGHREGGGTCKARSFVPPYLGPQACAWPSFGVTRRRRDRYWGRAGRRIGFPDIGGRAASTWKDRRRAIRLQGHGRSRWWRRARSSR